MDSSKNENLTISIQENLLLTNDQPQQQQQTPPRPSPPKKPRIKSLKTTIFLLILVMLIAGSLILYFICKIKRKPEQKNVYLSRSSGYYCHLTPYDDLCYSSMSSIINTTVLKSNPDLIFTASLQIAINELNNTIVSLYKALSSPTHNNPQVGPRLSECQTLVQNSLSRLNESLGLLGVDSDIGSLTYEEMDKFILWTTAAADNAERCLLLLEEIGEDEKKGVEEVKLGVEKANKLTVNSISLFDRKGLIFSDFYNPYMVEIYDDYSYDYYYFNFQYGFLVCMYSVMYLFIALLFFLFWKSK